MVGADASRNANPSVDGVGASPFVGRRSDVDTAVAALVSRRPVAVVGPAGIGKTTLARQAAQEWGRPLRAGAALDFLQSTPFLPLTRLLGRPPAPGDHAAVAAEVHAAVGDAVLLLDDLQWADPDTLEVLPALAAAVPLIVTVRSGTDQARRAVKHIEAVGVVLGLEPLDHEAALELACASAGADHPAARAAARRGGGNPLAIQVLARAPHARSDEAATTLRAYVESSSETARATLARLGLQDPAVCAESDGIAELVDRGMVQVSPHGDVAAVADLFAELALESLPEHARRSLHRQVAGRTDDLGDRARHHLAAGDLDLAHDLATRAAAEARTAAVRADLLTLAARAAPAACRWSATREAISALLDLGQVEATRELVEALAEVEPPSCADAIDRELMRVRLAIEEQRFQRVLLIADTVLHAYADQMSAQQEVSMLVMRAGAKGQLWDLAGALADAGEAKRLAEAHGVVTTRADMLLGALGMVTGDPQADERLRAVFEEAVGAGRYNEARDIARLHVMALFLKGRPDDALELCARAIGAAEQQNNLSWDREMRAIRAVNRSMIELGAPEVREELRDLLADPALTGERESVVTLLAVIESDRGDIEAADALLAPAREANAAARSQRTEALTWACAEVDWSAGRLRSCLDRTTELADASPLTFGRSSAAVLAKWVQLELGGDPGACPDPLVVYPVQRGLVAEARGVDLLAVPGREQEAAERFREAAELHRHYLRRHEVRCRWAEAESLRRAGQRDEAAALLEALELECEAHGLTPLARRVRASLRTIRTAPARHRGAARDLTDRQREVLALVRLGLSTHEIAARLLLKPSTVESHVRTAMRRVGASTRREAALLAHDAS